MPNRIEKRIEERKEDARQARKLIPKSHEFGFFQTDYIRKQIIGRIDESILPEIEKVEKQLSESRSTVIDNSLENLNINFNSDQRLTNEKNIVDRATYILAHIYCRIATAKRLHAYLEYQLKIINENKSNIVDRTGYIDAVNNALKLLKNIVENPKSMLNAMNDLKDELTNPQDQKIQQKLDIIINQNDEELEKALNAARIVVFCKELRCLLDAKQKKNAKADLNKEKIVIENLIKQMKDPNAQDLPNLFAKADTLLQEADEFFDDVNDFVKTHAMSISNTEGTTSPSLKDYEIVVDWDVYKHSFISGEIPEQNVIAIAEADKVKTIYTEGKCNNQEDAIARAKACIASVKKLRIEQPIVIEGDDVMLMKETFILCIRNKITVVLPDLDEKTPVIEAYSQALTEHGNYKNVCEILKHPTGRKMLVSTIPDDNKKNIFHNEDVYKLKKDIPSIDVKAFIDKAKPHAKSIDEEKKVNSERSSTSPPRSPF